MGDLPAADYYGGSVDVSQFSPRMVVVFVVGRIV
jgi:hypothetical protein